MDKQNQDISIDDILREYEAMSGGSDLRRSRVQSTVESDGDQVWRPIQKTPAQPEIRTSVSNGQRSHIVTVSREKEMTRRVNTNHHEQENKKSNDRHSGGKRAKIIVGVVLTTVLVCAGGAVAYTYTTDTVFRGVKAGTVDVGGLTMEQAQDKIAQQAGAVVATSTIPVKIYDTEYPIVIQEVTNGLDTVASAQAAFVIGHTGSPLERIQDAFAALFGQRTSDLVISINNDALNKRLEEIFAAGLTEPTAETWELQGSNLILTMPKPGVQFDRQKVQDDLYQKIRALDFTPYEVETSLTAPQPLDVDALKTKVDHAPINATVDKSDGKTIIPEQNGIVMDVAKAKEVIGDGSQPTYTIPVSVTPATVTKEVLDRALFRDVLASASTSLNTGNIDRTSNVTLAAKNMNGTILNPGDEFSYNEVVGPRTTERGFKSAGAYSNGKLIDDVGGGVCQPSSTLYMAVLRADLEVTSRTNHSMTVAYTPLGQDATVSYGSIDFKFKNNTPYPIKLETVREGGQMKVRILGTKADDKTVRLETDILETLEPKTVRETDNSLDPGETKVDQTATTGYKTVTYKYVTVNGQTTKEVANRSTYQKRDKIILVGPEPQTSKPASSETEKSSTSSQSSSNSGTSSTSDGQTSQDPEG